MGSLVEDKSYGLNDATVRSYNGINYLSMGSKSTITPIDDIADIAQIKKVVLQVSQWKEK